jgi:hypothetical protein
VVSDDVIFPQGPSVEAPVILVPASRTASPSSLRLLRWWWVGYKRVALKTLDLLRVVAATFTTSDVADPMAPRA